MNSAVSSLTSSRVSSCSSAMRWNLPTSLNSLTTLRRVSSTSAQRASFWAWATHQNSPLSSTKGASASASPLTALMLALASARRPSMRSAVSISTSAMGSPLNREDRAAHR